MDLSSRFLDLVPSGRVGGVTLCLDWFFFLQASDPKSRSRSQQRMISLLSFIVCRVDNDPEQLRLQMVEERRMKESEATEELQCFHSYYHFQRGNLITWESSCKQHISHFSY